MRPQLLEILRCPKSGQQLSLSEANGEGDTIKEGWLVTEDGQHRYAIRNHIPRFVPQSNYADNFGIQWNKFRQTQLDTHTGHPISSDRFWKATGWSPSHLEGRWVLDVGCGAGRFAEVALGAGANLVALDYSNAVDACYANLKHHPGLHVVQGDVYALPFSKESFSFIYSLGVLQHTPDVAEAFASLPPMVAEGGRLCVDFYELAWRSWLLPKYWLRPITKRLPKRALFRFLQLAVPIMLPFSNALGRVPRVGRALRRIVPVANYRGELPLNDEQLAEWALLDTFDWLSPEYDNPQSAATARAWLEAAHLKDVEVLRAGHLVARGVKRHDFGNRCFQE